MKIKKVDQREIKDFIKEIWSEYNKERGYVIDEKKFYYVVTKNNENIGYLHIKITSTVAYLSEIILKSEYRGQKIGYKLMELFEKIAKENKCHKMRIKTCPEVMDSAYYLYKKFGFNEEAILKNDYWNKDWVILSKFIDNKN